MLTYTVQVAAIVTQPPSERNRGRKVLPSPVAQRAMDKGFPLDLILTPVKAGEVDHGPPVVLMSFF